MLVDQHVQPNCIKLFHNRQLALLSKTPIHYPWMYPLEDPLEPDHTHIALR